MPNVLHKKSIISTVGQFGEFKPFIDQTKIVSKKKVVVPRPWQNECNSHLNNAQHRIINAPTGSGKSTAIMKNIVNVIKDNHTLAIISAPKRNIGQGFASTKTAICSYDNIEISINPDNHLCEGVRPDQGNIQHLINTIKSNRDSDINERIIVCTHSTLVTAFKQINKKYLKDIILWIDESHHVSSDTEENNLGEVVAYFLKNDNKKELSVNLASATPFRGDRANIIPAKQFDKFTSFDLAYDRHFQENCNNLTFTYDFYLHEYNEGHAKALKNIFSQDIKKTIVFIPHPNHSISNPLGKFQEFDDVCIAIAGRKNYTKQLDSNGILNIKRKNKWIKVLDLIDPTGRDDRLSYLQQNPDDIDVVVSIDIAKEGFDWISATREIIIGKRNSLNDLIQMMGRCFRAHDSKGGDNPPVEIIQIFPWVNQSRLNKDDFKDQLNDYMKAVYASLVLEMIVNPVNVKIPSNAPTGGQNGNTALGFLKDRLSEENFKKFNEEIINDMVDWSAINENCKRVDFVRQFHKIVTEKLENFGINTLQSAIADAIIQTWDRRSKLSIKSITDGFDVSKINYNIIDDVNNPLETIIMACGSGICDATKLREFRECCNGEDTLARCLELKEWCEKNGRFPLQQAKFSDEKSLAYFISTRKNAYNKGDGIITPQQIDILESITNWKWVADDKTLNNCRELKEWIRKNKKYPWRGSKDQGEAFLARFITSIKRTYHGKCKAYSINKEHIDILESIDDWQWVNDNTALKKCYRLKKWIKKNKRFPRRTSIDQKEVLLEAFIKNKRVAYKGEGNNRLSITQEEINILESIPNWLWSESDGIVKKCYELKKWIEEHNNTHPNPRSEDDRERVLGHFKK
jgi:DEAD/DEAH box helicase/Helicase conserved C-terminal domain